MEIKDTFNVHVKTEIDSAQNLHLTLHKLRKEILYKYFDDETLLSYISDDLFINYCTSYLMFEFYGDTQHKRIFMNIQSMIADHYDTLNPDKIKDFLINATFVYYKSMQDLLVQCYYFLSINDYNTILFKIVNEAIEKVSYQYSDKCDLIMFLKNKINSIIKISRARESEEIDLLTKRVRCLNFP
jgi:hypothetical protein